MSLFSIVVLGGSIDGPLDRRNSMNRKNFKAGRYPILLTAIFAIASGCDSGTNACEGDDYNRTLLILDASLRLGYQCGFSDNCDFKEWPSCQAVIESVGEALKRANTKQETQCYGGVCCGPSGCI